MDNQKLLTDGYPRVRKQPEYLPPLVLPPNLVWNIKNVTPKVDNNHGNIDNVVH